MRLWRRVLAGLVLVVSARTASAQEIRGTVRDSASHRPVISAVITLLDSAGAVLGRNITNDAGGYRLAGIGPTRRLRVTRIGYRPRVVNVNVTPTNAVTMLDIDMASLPTMLEPIRVSSGADCPARSDRLAALGLLEQARAGLLSAVVARDMNPATMVRLTYRRFLSGNDRIEYQNVRIDSSEGVVKSFKSVYDAGGFVRNGFRRNNDGTLTYFGPDAETLLDDAFRDGYCFELARPEPARVGQVGLRFVPARSRRDRIEIDGTLWVDTTARELREIVYRYLNVEREPASVSPGGSISFAMLANGFPIIDRWHIRMPSARVDTIYDKDRMRPRTYFVPFENGGEVATATWRDGFSWNAPLGRARFLVTDGRGRPIRDAVLHLDEGDYFARSDADGVVTIPRLLPGPYEVLSADHDLAPIGVELPVKLRIVAERDRETAATITLPTAIDFTRAGCKELMRREPDSTREWFVGRAYDRDGQPMKHVRWEASRVTASGERLQMSNAAGISSSDGLFFGCSGYDSHDRIAVRLFDPVTSKWVEFTQEATGRLTVIRADLSVRMARP